MALVGEDQATRLAALLREQQPQGRMIGNMYLAPGIGDYIQQGFNTYDAVNAAKDEREQAAANAKAAISALNQYGISAPESLLRQTQPKQSGMERLINFFKGGEAEQPYQQNVAVNPSEQQRKNALIQLALSGNQDVAKMIAPNLFGGAIKPSYFTQGGKVFAVDVNNPLQASPVMAGEKQLENDIYSAITQGNIAKAKTGAQLHKVTTPSGGEIMMTGSEILGEDNGHSLHVGDVVSGKTYMGGNPNDPSSWR